MAGAYVGLGIILIFTLSNLLDLLVSNARRVKAGVPIAVKKFQSLACIRMAVLVSI